MPPPAELPPLPVGSPRSWQARSPVAADAPAVLELAAACDVAVLGHPDVALGDVESALAHGADHQALVVDGDRVVVWVLVEDRAAGRTPADVYVDPQLALGPDGGLGDSLAGWGWDLARSRARAIAAARGVASTGLETETIDGDRLGERRVTAAGFRPVRTFWRMQRPLSPADAEPEPVPGVTVRGATSDDGHSAYDVVETAFADHWNYHPRTFDEWWAHHAGGSGADIGLWWIAEIDGRPVGALIATRQMAEEDAIYIDMLATLREARGRGVATALLRKAFAAGLEQGWSLAKLDVDSDNTTSAPSLYAGLGMELAFAIRAWQQDVAAF